MKYILSTIICIYSFIAQIQGQTPPKLSLGFKAGTNTPGLSVNSSDPVIDGYKTVLEPLYGMVLETGLNKKWSILTEFNYTALGITKNGSQVVPQSTYAGYEFGTLTLPAHVYANFDSKIVLKYFEVPIMLKYSLYENKQLNFYVNGGPSVGILLNGNVNTSGKGKIYSDVAHTKEIAPFNFSFVQQKNLTDWFNSLNLELQLGTGFSYKSNIGEFFVNLEGNVGLMRIQANSGDGSNNTKAMTLAVGYLFHIWQ